LQINIIEETTFAKYAFTCHYKVTYNAAVS